MTKRTVKTKRKPLGRPLAKATDKDAEITPEDIERAKMWVSKYGSNRFVAMLEAKPEDEGDFE
jgi:hypothetical protein